MDKKEKIEEVKLKAAGCKKCNFWKDRTNVVFGAGNPESRILFVGEAPGYNEDKRGIPFCGKAGDVLDRLLVSVNLGRNDIYITNVIKCRPPNNRDPLDEEIDNCSEYLEKQIDIMKPEVICCLGRHALKNIFTKFSIQETGTISSLHGKVFEKSEDIFNRVKIVALYHPAVAVYNPGQFSLLQKDFSIIKEI
ncbi:MAG TPA: uracil-DNA glycosylase [bacterium]|nr:uracil-DNA glycosylase [bacterium]